MGNWLNYMCIIYNENKENAVEEKKTTMNGTNYEHVY